MKTRHTALQATILFLVLIFTGFAQVEIPVNEYGLKVVNDIKLYHRLVATDSAQILTNLETVVPSVKKDIKYATVDNVTGKVLYTSPRVFLRHPAAIALKKIARELALNGIGIVIYDAYRPYTITKKIWDAVRDENYAASPKTGSRHNRGCAIDLGLYDLKTGKLLLMPTVFDDFTVKAHHDFADIPLEIRVNRALLRTVMEKHGFVALETEWWHYDFSGWQNFPLMDIEFEAVQ
jgi:D-alanyl-D-alanine dipeptidase